MKKKLIIGLLLVTSLLVVGCNKDKESSNVKPNNVVSTDGNNTEQASGTSARSSDEMYELYTSKLTEVEKLFKDNTIAFKEKNNDKNKKYDGKVAIIYEDSSKKQPGEIPSALYSLNFEDNGEIKYISANISLNLIEDEMKNKEFKFEDTEFYKLHNILVSDNKNTDEINKKVNDAYKNLISIKNIESQNGKIKEMLTLTPDSINYIIIINP